MPADADALVALLAGPAYFHRVSGRCGLFMEVDGPLKEPIMVSEREIR